MIVGNLRRALQFPRELSITSSQLDIGRAYMANTISRVAVSGDRSGAEGIPRSASGATRDNRITGSADPSVTETQLRKSHEAPAGRRGTAEGGDEVQITNRAAKLATLGQSLSASSPVDEARVARISQALADGSYRISAQQIATGLMQSDHALGQIGL